MAQLLGKQSRKIQPKLRIIANGSSEVNTIRAEQSSVVSVNEELSKGTPVMTGETPTLATEPLPTPDHLKELADGVFVNVFIEAQASNIALPRLKGKAQCDGVKIPFCLN